MTITRPPSDRIGRLLDDDLGPTDVTDDEAEAMAAILQGASNRKHEGVIDIRSVRTRRHRPATG
jgi:hypothetical protein